jgi:hypothetical protein
VREWRRGLGDVRKTYPLGKDLWRKGNKIFARYGRAMRASKGVHTKWVGEERLLSTNTKHLPCVISRIRVLSDLSNTNAKNRKGIHGDFSISTGISTPEKRQQLGGITHNLYREIANKWTPENCSMIDRDV